MTPRLTIAARAERLKALLRCVSDPDEQYKHWPPLFGTSSYRAWRRMTKKGVGAAGRRFFLSRR